jgi:tetratricopeptide (TPR) repeat protein
MGEARGSRRGRLRLLWLVAVASTTGFVHARMDTSTPAASGRLRLPDPRIARTASLGFAPVLADWAWVQVLQVVGGELGDVGRHADTIGSAIELVTDLDPWVDHPYRFAAIWLTGSVQQVERANRLLEKALAYHPLDWRNRFYLGYNEFFYLQNNARAARVLESAIGLHGAPAYLGSLVTRLRAEGGDLETAALFLQELIRSAPDEYARAEYLKAYDEIETERRARLLDRARAVFRARHGRDIQTPAELWSGPLRVLRVMPPPHPHFEGFEWTFDPKTGEIVSSFYQSRYGLHIHPDDVEQRERWRAESDARGASSAADAGEKETGT